MDLSSQICDSCPSGWPTWQTPYNVQLSPYLQGTRPRLDPAAIIAHTRRTAHRKASPEEFWAHLEVSLILLIYGSNFIDSVGCDLDITWQICREVFRGNEDIGEAIMDVDHNDASYFGEIAMLLNTGRKATVGNIVNARREIISHAQALGYIIDRIVCKDEDWSEALILKTHEIVQNGDAAAGRYRDHEVAVSYDELGSKKVKRSLGMRANAVPLYMEDLVTNLNKELKTYSSGHIDPYTLAAKYSHHFAMIHPFSDGNGRMSRIILNVLLLKYAGHVAPIGHEGDKEDYLAVVRRAGEAFTEEHRDVGFEEQKSHEGVARFVLEKSGRELKKVQMWSYGCC